MKEIRTVVLGKRSARVLHIETDLGIINIRPHLHNMEGQAVVSVEILTDAGVTLDGYINSRLIKEGGDANEVSHG
jgi:hypothetical protein